jgi:YD repeat-containing protein
MKINRTMLWNRLLPLCAILLIALPALAGNVSYTYDALNRLTRAAYEDGTVVEYSYDAAGNRTRHVVQAATVNFTLSVTKTGAGAGTVTSIPPGIDCGATCVASFDSVTSVTLTASPADGSTFAGWSQTRCGSPLTLTADTTCTATFNLANRPPMADAGPDQTVRLGSLVTLDGGNSADPDAGPSSSLSFAWTRTAGPDVALTGADSAKPTFTPTVKGAYTFRLTVNDGQANSAPDEVTITVPMLGDLDGDHDVDQNDVNVVTAARNTPANGPNDLRDINGDLKIDALDARKLVNLCTRPRCATQ